MGDLVDAAKVISEPCARLIDAFSRAMGKVYEPRYTRKMAEAKAYEIEVMSEAIRKSIDLPITYYNGDISMTSEDIDLFIKRTSYRFTFQELLRQKNLDSVFDKTFSILENEPQEDSHTDEQIDNDWMLRYINAVQDITDEDMQLLWACVLAGELKKPKTYSLRTLEVLRNLSKEEAVLFKNYCSYAVTAGDNIFIPNSKTYFKTNAIEYRNLILLGECGLIITNDNINYSVNIEKKTLVFVGGDLLLSAVTKNGAKKKMEIAQYPFTSAGKELYRLTDAIISEEIFLSLAKEVKKQYPAINVSVHRILEKLNDDSYRINENDLLV